METSIDDPFPSFSLILLIIQFSPALFYIINGFMLALLLVLSGLVSGSEVAFFSLTSLDIHTLKSGNTFEKMVFRLISKPKRLLATILILNNFINISFVTLSTYVSWKIAGSNNPEGPILVILTFIVTFLIVYFGEVVPKIIANHRSVKFARFTVPFIDFAFKLFRPLSWFLMMFSNIIEKRITKKGYKISVDDLNQALEITTSEETTEEEKGILKGIVNFGQLYAKQVMKSRVDITAFDIEMNFHDLMDKINKCGFSRIPIFKETIDNIEGILYNKDLLPHLDKKENFKWQKLIRPPFFIPETKKIDTLLKDFQNKHVHMAIVVDEYGGTSGLLTLEDVIEEIVGEIRDEFDEEEIVFNKLNDNTFIFEGKTTLIDFCKITNQDLNQFEEVKGESESLGGLLLEISGKLPRAGEKILFNKFVFTVMAVDHKRIKRVRILIK